VSCGFYTHYMLIVLHIKVPKKKYNVSDIVNPNDVDKNKVRTFYARFMQNYLSISFYI
jgi:hypothetical protein